MEPAPVPLRKPRFADSPTSACPRKILCHTLREDPSHCSVHRVQKKMGLSLLRHGPRSPVLTAAQKKQVLALLRRGMGTGRIAVKLGLREHAVRGVVKESHFRHAPGRRGCRYQVPAETLAKLTDEIRARTNFGVDLAQKYPELSYRVILKLARKILGVSAFRTGRRRSPLESDFPQKHLHVHQEVGHG